MKLRDKIFKFPDGFIWRFHTNFSLYLRKKKYSSFIESFKPTKETSVLDVGVHGDEFSDYAPTNFFEKWYPYKNKLTALAVDDLSELKKRYPEMTTVVYDGKKFPFKDNQFDIVFCNAVIEHVGSNKDQQYFLDEILRVSNQAFVTTPNRWFFIELHTLIPFLHWLPMNVFRKICGVLGFEYLSQEKNLNLLTASNIKNWLKKYQSQKKIKIKSSILSPNIIIIIKE